MARGPGSIALPQLARPEPAAARVRPGLGLRLRRRLPGVASVSLVVFVLIVLFGPVLMLALFSFNDSPIISLPWEGFTTRWYEEAWSAGQARDAVLNSLLVASLVTIGSLVLGTLAAWGLTRLRFAGRGIAAGLHGSVLVVPWLIIGVAGLIFFSQLGIALSLQTVGLMQLVVTFPLVVAIVSAGLIRFSRSLEEAAIDLGASQAQMLRYVVLPQIAPSLAAAAIFAFAWSFNNFEISFFVGGFDQTFPVWVFSILRQSENLPVVNAVSTVIALAQVLAVFGAWQLIKRLSRRGGGSGDEALKELMTGAVR
jgi:spermidine/putrescine transport system permease protein